MRRELVLVAVGILAVGACRRDRDDDDRAATDPTSPTVDVGALGVGDGETVYAERGARPVVWRPAGGEPVVLYVVRKGDGAGILRAKHAGATKDGHQDLMSFALRPGHAPELELRPDVGGRATFRYGPLANEEGTDRAAHGVALLGWDADDRQVRVVKRWRGYPGGEPAWLRTGKTDLDGVALASCERVVRRIAACADDAGFRRVFLAGRPAADRDRAFERAGRWSDAAAARGQCQRWAASDETTPLSDAREVEELARDAELPCDLFARELADEQVLALP